MFNYANRAKGYIFWNTIGRPFRSSVQLIVNYPPVYPVHRRQGNGKRDFRYSGSC